MLIITSLAPAMAALAMAQSSGTPSSGLGPEGPLGFGQTDQPRSEAFLNLARLAEMGNREAQFQLGTLYSKGQEVWQDDEMAVWWWQKAAEQGLDAAQNELGVALAAGRGAALNPGQAVQWYTRAAEQGLAVAQANLGMMYWNGTGVRKNPTQAIKWWRKAADQGLGWAQLYLGDAYSSGLGVPKNKEHALGWYRKAADQNYSEAQFTLGVSARSYPPTSIGVRDGPLEAYGEYWVALAAQGGYEPAEAHLESMLQRSCTRVKLSTAAAVRTEPKAGARIIRHTNNLEQACMLRPPSVVAPRLKEWAAVYLHEGFTVGFVSTVDVR